MKIRAKSWQKIIPSLLAIITLLLSFSRPAHADGGAPNLAYVSGTAHDISVIDVGLGKVIATIQLAGNPATILLSLDGSALYVSQPDANQVSVLATYTKRITCTAHLSGKPTLLALDPYTNTLYAAGSQASRVSALDPRTCAIRHTFETGSPVHGLAVAVAGNGIARGNHHQLWVSGTDKITVFDAETTQSLAHIPVPGGPQYLTSPPGATMYATTRQGSIYAIDFKTLVIRQLLSGGPFGPMDYDALTGEIYVPDQKNSQLAVLSPVDPTSPQQPKQPARVIHTPVTPESVAITSDGQLGFVALHNGTVAMLDVPARQFAYTVAVGGAPYFIITGLYPPVITQSTPPAQKEVQTQPGPGWNQLPPWAFTGIVVAYTIVVLSLVLIFVLLLRRVIKNRRQQK